MRKKKGRHKSLDKEMKKSIQWLENQASISKIVLSISESCRHKFAPGTIRFKKDVEGGIKVNGYSGRGITDIFIKIEPIKDREQIKALIQNRFF